jgi:hypothetical protein
MHSGFKLEAMSAIAVGLLGARAEGLSGETFDGESLAYAVVSDEQQGTVELSLHDPPKQMDGFILTHYLVQHPVPPEALRGEEGPPEPAA